MLEEEPGLLVPAASLKDETLSLYQNQNQLQILNHRIVGEVFPGGSIQIHQLVPELDEFNVILLNHTICHKIHSAYLTIFILLLGSVLGRGKSRIPLFGLQASWEL